MRVALVTTSNQFIFEGNRFVTKDGLKSLGPNPRYQTRATGGHLATLALIRFLAKRTELTVLAIETIDEQLKTDPTRVEVERWEGEDITIHRGAAPALSARCAAAVADSGGFDISFCSLADKRLLTLALQLGAKRAVSIFHDYHSLPWGPYSIQGGQGVEAKPLVMQLDALLCTSQDVASYSREWGPSNAPKPIACPATDYNYFAHAIVAAAASPAAGGGGAPLPPPPPPPLRLEPWTHQYCTMVSPCASKGLGVLLRLCDELPHVPFLAVQTAWTKPRDLLAMHTHNTKRNLTVVPAVNDFTQLLRQTRVLLAPSLWREPYGLVALEASLLGIPTLSTAHGGLAEANPVAELRVEADVFADFQAMKVRRMTGTEFECAKASGRIELEDARAAAAGPSQVTVVSAAAMCFAASEALAMEPDDGKRVMNPKALLDAAVSPASQGPLDALDPNDLQEGGWYGPIPASAAPIAGLKAKLEAIFGEGGHAEAETRRLSSLARETSQAYAAARADGLLRSLQSVLGEMGEDEGTQEFDMF